MALKLGGGGGGQAGGVLFSKIKGGEKLALWGPPTRPAKVFWGEKGFPTKIGKKYV